jgi:hypothetical protein
MAPITIDYPPIDDDNGRYVSELTLFLDESGNVVRARVDGPRLPFALEEAARSAFLAARFAPGWLVGETVKSRIRVEVVFERTGSNAQAPARLCRV